MKKKLKVLVLDRKKWCRGKKNRVRGLSKLLTSRSTMCCLGFLGKQCGVKNMLNVDLPSETKNGAWPKDIAYYETAIAEINDATDTAVYDAADDAANGKKYDDSTRIKALEPYFNKIGYTLRLK